MIDAVILSVKKIDPEVNNSAVELSGTYDNQLVDLVVLVYRIYCTTITDLKYLQALWQYLY